MGAKISSQDGVITIGHAKNLIGTTVEAGEIRAGVVVVRLGFNGRGYDNDHQAR